MSRLRMLRGLIAIAVLSTGLAVVPGLAADTTQSFTGKVSDAMCGAKHTEGNLAPAACVRDCVQKGAKYALVVGDKVYTLSTSDQAALSQLNKLAWGQATVTGTASGDIISVKSVTAAKESPVSDAPHDSMSLGRLGCAPSLPHWVGRFVALQV